MIDYPVKEKMIPKQFIRDTDLLAFLTGGQFRFPPLQVEAVQPEARIAGCVLDALLTLRWGKQTYGFVVETCRLWTPKAVSEKMDQVRRYALLTKTDPLILVPYLSEERLLELEAQGISGIDLCGNGFIVVPGKLLVLRTGSPNRFRWSGTIKNVYRKNSSIVARAFLLVPQFGSVQEVLKEIQKRGGEITLATVSKVCKSLEADLVIERASAEAPRRRPASHLQSKKLSQPLPRMKPPSFVRRTRLLQAEKLLDLLARNYAPPEVRLSFRGKVALQPEELRKRLESLEKESGVKTALTGESSVEAYAVMAREPMQSFYCTDIEGVIRSLGSDLRETDRFANVTLLETRDNFVYFDRRPGLIASPIQSYLELLAGDKREQETAEQVRRVLLEPLGKDARGE
ncbi:MAG: hypothetical protein ACYC3I_01685 [Gemmataceae bacterium]